MVYNYDAVLPMAPAMLPCAGGVQLSSTFNQHPFCFRRIISWNHSASP